MGCMPVLTGSLAIGGYVMTMWGWDFIPAFMLGLTLSGVGSAHVLATLQVWKGQQMGPVPRLCSVAVPLEVVTVLCSYGIMQGFATPGNHTPLSASIGLGIIFKLVGTAVFVFVIAFVFAQLAENRNEITFRGKSLFVGTVNEELLILMSAVLVTYVLTSDQPVVIPNGYSITANIFQPELGVVLVSLFYGQFRSRTIHKVEEGLLSVWMFAALFLFTSLGTKIDYKIFASAGQYLVLLFVGLAARFVIIMFIAFLMPLNPKRTWFRREEGHRLKTFYEALFCWTVSIYRGTLQGQLGKVPLANKLFSPDMNKQMLNAGSFFLAFCSPFGALCLDFLGNWSLHKIKQIANELDATHTTITEEVSQAKVIEAHTDELELRQSQDRMLADLVDLLKGATIDVKRAHADFAEYLDMAGDLPAEPRGSATALNGALHSVAIELASAAALDTSVAHFVRRHPQIAARLQSSP